MDTAGNNFAKPIVLTTTQDYSFSITVGAMNDFILGVFKGIGGQAGSFQFRVLASLAATNPATNNVSEVITLGSLL